MENIENHINRLGLHLIASLLIIVLIVAFYYQPLKNAIGFVLMKFYEFFIQHNRS
ncbi:MAG TPA: hypothetical protein VMT76_01925 [Puia sp.]|nr:hypothetical protein [Puia sp.]